MKATEMHANTEAHRAWKRVGITAESRARWLSKFAAVNLDILRTATLQDFRAELTAFLIIAQAGPTLPGRRSPTVHPAVALAASLPMHDSVMVSESDTKSIHRWLADGFTLLANSDKWRFRPQIEYELDAYKGILSYRLKANSNADLFKSAVYELMRDARARFRLCRLCRRPFLPVRRQLHCSVRCSGTWRKRLWRQRHPEKARELRRKEYASQKRAYLKAPNLTVGRKREQ
jgi:hypothetical protein